MDRLGAVTFQGNALTLTGKAAKAGDPGLDFTVLDAGLAPVNKASFAGKIAVLLTVPSLDTPVCDLEIRRFNEAATNLSPDVKIACISMDLPFAQARWCGAAGVKRIQALSDHRDASFGMNYGLLIKELRLLARAVVVLDRTGKIAYLQLVKEITQEPDYQAVLSAVAGLA